VNLSIVTTLYRSASFIAEFHSRVSAAAEAITHDYELIFVNDGSPDDSLERVLAIAGNDPHVKVIDLSRNFGHHPAILAGLSHASGERVYLIDVDLEEQPEWLPTFWTTLEASDADVVYGIQKERKGSFFKRHTGALFYTLFNFASRTELPRNACTVRLMKKSYVQAILSLTETNVFLAGLFYWAGFRQIGITVDKSLRPSRSTYTLGRLFTLFVDALTSFSAYPLKAIFFIGIFMTAASMTAGIYMIVRKLLHPDLLLMGYSSIMVSVCFLGGLIICFLGIIGVYLSAMFTETKQRPRYLIRSVWPPSSHVPGVAADDVHAGRPVRL
jgi:putative glycosyltransferase